MKRLLFVALLLLLGFYVAWPAYSGYRIHKALETSDVAALAARIDFPSVRRSMRAPVMAKIDERMSDMVRQLGPAALIFTSQIPKTKIEGIIDGALQSVVNPQRLTTIYSRQEDLAFALQTAILEEIDKAGGIDGLLGTGGAGAKPDANPAGSAGKSPAGGLPAGLPGLFGELLKAGRTSGAGGAAGGSGFDAGNLEKMLFPKARATPARSGTDKPESFGLGNIKSVGFAGPLGLALGVAKEAGSPEADVTAQMEFKDLDWIVTKLSPNLSRF